MNIINLSHILLTAIAVKHFIYNPEMPQDTTKTSRAEITLKSATLPRRKPVKSDVKVDIEAKPDRGMRFSTEMQHQIPDLRSAPIQEHPYSPISPNQPRATSLEPKELIIPIQRPPAYQKTSSASVRYVKISESINSIEFQIN